MACFEGIALLAKTHNNPAVRERLAQGICPVSNRLTTNSGIKCEKTKMTTDYDQLRDYMLKKAGTTNGYPFGPDVLVFKVMNKMWLSGSLQDRSIKNVLSATNYTILRLV